MGSPSRRSRGDALEFLRTYPRDALAVSVVFMESGPLAADVAALGVPTAAINAGRLRSPLEVARTIRALAGTMRRRRPDILLNWMAKAQLYGAPAAVLSGAPPRHLVAAPDS